MSKARLGGGLALVIGAAVAACGGGASTTGRTASTPAAPPGAAKAAACEGASTAEPIGATSSGSAVALARVGTQRVAYVADEDAKAILTVDLETRAQLAETPVGGIPGQVLVADDGRVLVTVRDRSELVALTAGAAAAPLTRRCAVKTAAEPVGLAIAPATHTLVVTSGWGSKLTSFDARTLARQKEVALPREPRSVVVSDDGKTAFVSHAVGSVASAVDLTKGTVKSIDMRGRLADEIASNARQRKLALAIAKKDKARSDRMLTALADPDNDGRRRESCQGFALAKSASLPGRVFAPQVFVDPGDLEQRPDGYGDEDSQTEVPAVAVLDEGAALPVQPSMAIEDRRGGRPDPRDPRPECLLPRAAAVDAGAGSLLVTCFGIDALVAYDARSATPLRAEKRRWTVGSGPTGVAVDGEKRRAVVWSQFDRTLSIVPLGGEQLVDTAKAAPPPVAIAHMPDLANKLSPEYALGRILFHAAGDARVSGDGRACASCHPDGRDDAITWATPEGPRRSIMLAGRVATTAPYSWNGNEHTIHNHLANTFDRLSGKGLRSVELDALVAYLTHMPAPQNDPQDATKVARGREIFASAEAGCASCHEGKNLTDGALHDVKSKHKADKGTKFNTPSLHLVGGTGPYFHDGRYKTLKDLLRGVDGTMGKTKHLSSNDLDSLEAYLRTL